MTNSPALTTLWAIDRDYLAEDGDESRVGFGQTGETAQATIASFNGVVGRTHYMDTGLKVSSIPAEYRVRFKLMDEDGEVYYGGACDGRILTGDLVNEDDEGDDLGYNIDRFGMDDVGAVVGLYRTEDLERIAPGKRIGCDYKSQPGWQVIYG